MPAARRGVGVLPSPHPGSSGSTTGRRAEEKARGERLARPERITAGAEIRDLFRRGKRMRSRYVDVIVAASPVSHPRLGAVVPKYRNSGVERNLIKRRIREIGRRELLPRLREAGIVLDILVRARPEAYGAPFDALRDDLVRTLEKIR